MARTLCVVLPWFRSQRITRASDQPEPELAIIQRRGNTQIVTGVSIAATRAGVRQGMTLAAARALLPTLTIVPQNDEAEADALNLLAESLYQFTPNIRLAPPNGILLDITGTLGLYPDESELAERIKDCLAELGYAAQVAIAENATAAMTLALSEPLTIAEKGHANAAFQDTPLAALRLDDRTEKALRDLGLTKVSEVLRLPANGLPQRFGDALVQRIRQLRGELEETFPVWKPSVAIRERVDFTAPTNSYTALLFLLKQGAGFFASRLDARSLGARRIEVKFVCSDDDDLAFGFDTARPTNDARGIETLLLTRFEKLDRGDRWFEALTLTAPSVEPIEQNQQDLFSPDGAQTSTGELQKLIDELVGRLGNTNVVRAILTDDPHPSRSFRYVPYLSKEQGSEPKPVLNRPTQIDRKRTIAVECNLPELPVWWDFTNYDGPLQVIHGPERLTDPEPTDFFTIETPDGGQHWCAFTAGRWWLPRAMSDHRDNVAELSRFGVTRTEAETTNANPYAELVCATNFSFLRGASTAEQLFHSAKDAGLHALAVTDWHSFAGIVRAHVAAKEAGIKLIVGTRIPLRDGPDICLYAMTRKGYAHLCRLLTLGKRRTGKGDCELYLRDLPEFAGDLQCVVLNADHTESGVIESLKSVYNDRLSLGVSRHYHADDEQRLSQIVSVGEKTSVPLVAVNDVHWHDADQKFVQDIQTGIREGVTLEEAAGLRFANAERRIKRPSEIAALFRDNPEWIARSVEIADSCTFSLDELKYEYPDEVVPNGMTMQEYLEQETWSGAEWRYPDGVPDEVTKLIKKELKLIDELGYAAYFLTVYDIVRYARGEGILCQGRGSAANSSVCFCLGVTSVDPTRINLLFERFISRERNEPPDIDVDFEHERREEVLQYIYGKYGRHRTGIAATTITYRSRSLARDVGKACGLSDDQVDRLAKNIQWWDTEEQLTGLLAEAGLSAKDSRVQLALRGMKALRGFPRHLSQHVGGMVMTQGRLDEIVPIENAAMAHRTVIEWDKDDIEALGILKVDCLSLGMLTACRKAFDLIRDAGGQSLDFVRVFECDPEGTGHTSEAKAIYQMLHKADAIGTFQVESRAQLSMLPRMKPKEFYDLVVEVAIVRPGPIQGGMVHPYLRRREGSEKITYPYPPLIPVLEKTYGVPLFQEQAMSLAVVAAGYTPGEADRLRKDMGSWRRDGVMERHRAKLVQGMTANGIDSNYADQIYDMISGFGEYGFPESHAASFAVITFVSCYLKRFYPAAFTAALLNSQPMGFYNASSLIRDAREHGVSVKPVDINASDWDSSLEGTAYQPAGLDDMPNAWGDTSPSLRLGLRQVRDVSKSTGEALLKQRAKSPFVSVTDMVRRVRSKLPIQRLRHDMQALANADVFASLGVSRRKALWEIQQATAKTPKLFETIEEPPSPVTLPTMDEVEHIVADYHSVGLSLRGHPMEFLRDQLATEGVVPASELGTSRNGRRVEVAGLVLAYQRPSTAAGISFVTLEDETSTANLVVYPSSFEANRKVLLRSKFLAVRGKVERKGDVVHLLVHGVRSLDERITKMQFKQRRFH